MAVYKLFPIQDATVYSGYPSMNSGLDSLLEVTSEFPQTLTPSPRVARSLLKFDQNEIDDVIDNKIINANWSGSLKSYVSVAQGVNFNSTLKVYPISGSWYNGTGEYLDSPQTTNGVSWLYSNFKEGHLWEVDTNRPFVTSSYTTGNSGGTTFFTGSNNVNISSITGSQTFTPRSSRDLNIPVTDTIKIWHSASKSTDSGYIRVNNDGFILKWDDNIEFSPSQSIQPVIKFYSVDTNTIYPPTLEFKWDDFVYSTSLTEIATTDLFIGLDSNPGTFYSESVNRFRLNVRPEFPIRTFKTTSLYTENFALPSASYYAIKDLDTNEFVVDFDDNFTKISCDNTSNFFDVYMNGLEPERYYKILVKTTINGSIIVKDEDYYFKVING